MKTALTFLALSAALLWGNFAPTTHAGVVLQPAAVSTNMGFSASDPPGNTINKVSLNPNYTTLVTDFDTYIASNPTHNSNVNSWFSSPGTPTGNFDFDLGGTFTIESFALWNLGVRVADSSIGGNVKDFELLASLDNSFTNPTSLGNFTAASPTELRNAVRPKAFTWDTPTSAAFVRMVITSNYGGATTAFGEAAFEVQTGAVPEAGSLAIWGLLGAAFSVAAWRQRK